MSLFPLHNVEEKPEWAKKTFSSQWLKIIPNDILSSLKVTLDTVNELRDQRYICPRNAKIFSAFNDLNPKEIRVIIIGQDPYFTPKTQATGRAFACGVKPSPSILQIINAIEGVTRTPHEFMNLDHWVIQGVFLLNRWLTVPLNDPKGHRKIMWDKFTSTVVKGISQIKQKKVWLLWGNDADEMTAHIETNEFNYILRDEHPAAASHRRDVWSTNCFKQTNIYFEKHNLPVIHWSENFEHERKNKQREDIVNAGYDVDDDDLPF